MNVTHEQLSEAVKKIDEKVDAKFDKLIESLQDVSTQMSNLCLEIRHSSENQKRIEQNQREQGKLLAEHDRQLIRIQTRQDGIVGLAMKFLPAPLAFVAAISSVLVFLKG